MGIRMLKTCWATFERQAINLLLIAASDWLIQLNRRKPSNLPGIPVKRHNFRTANNLASLLWCGWRSYKVSVRCRVVIGSLPCVTCIDCHWLWASLIINVTLSPDRRHAWRGDGGDKQYLWDKKRNLEYGENTNYPEKTALFVAHGLM